MRKSVPSSRHPLKDMSRITHRANTVTGSLKHNNHRRVSKGEHPKADSSPDKLQQLVALVIVILYCVSFVTLAIAAFITQNFFLFPIINLMLRDLAYAFRRAIDMLL